MMTYENPMHLAESLRRVAARKPRRMLSGHGIDMRDPVESLVTKAVSIERAVAQSRRLVAEGVGLREVVRRVFPRGLRKDRMMALMTQGEFSRLNFVRAVVASEMDPPEIVGGK